MKKRDRTSIIRAALAAILCAVMLPSPVLAADGDFMIESGVLTSYNGPGGQVAIPDGVTEIGRNFYRMGSREITSIIIPDSVTIIGDSAFNQGASLTSVTIGEGVTNIGPYAFSACTGLTSITIPDSVTSLGEYAFIGCTSLTDAVIGSGVTDYGSSGSTFQSCTALTSVILKEGVSSIARGMFGDCPSLTNITLPTSLTSIGDGAFYSTALTNVAIPDGVISIGSTAFLDSAALTSVTIPASVTSIGVHAFHEQLGFESYRPLPGLTLSVTANSYAEAYAQEEGIPFVSTGGTTTPTTPTTPTDPITPTDPVAPVTPPATDQPSTWAEAQVNGAIAANLVPQALQSQYTQPTTRAEFCALAAALYEVATGAEITGRTAFTDTLDENVQKMAALGVVSGVGDGRFDPEGKLTREQAATMLSRLANALGKPLTAQAPTFADNASISAWALDAVGQVQAAGIMGGVGDNAFAPQADYTREQSILTIGRLYELVKA